MALVAFKICRAGKAQSTVQALPVIKDFDVLKDGGTSFLQVSKLLGATIDQLQFERAPESFHDGVVIAIGLATHGSDGLSCLECLTILATGVLDAAIGVKDQSSWWLTMSAGHVPGGHNQGRIDVLTESPPDNPTAIEIQDGRQINVALSHRNISDVGHPDLILAVRCVQAGQAIGSNWLVMFTVGGNDAIAPSLPTPDTGLAHQAAQTITSVPLPQFAQADLNAWAAVGLATVLMKAHDLSLQLLVLLGAQAGLTLPPTPVIVTTGRDDKGRTERADGVLVFQGVDPLEALFGGSEMIPKVFFKMSRCCRKRATSWRKAAISSSRWASVAAVAGPYSPFQPYKWFCDMPNWALISRADLPLLNHSATASRLNVASYFRRGLIGAAELAAFFTSFMTLAFQFSPLAGVRQIEATSLRQKITAP